MFKKAIVFIVAFTIGAICAVVMASTIRTVAPSYYVDQYALADGLKITIDHNTYKNMNGVICYLGCYNNGKNDIVFVYQSDEEWEEILYSYDENYYKKKSVLNEWRW